MKVLPIVKCKGCPVLLEFAREDIKEQGVGFKFTVECPLCHATMLVNDMMTLFPKEEPVPVPVKAAEPEPLPPPVPAASPRADTEAERAAKAVKAYDAYQKHTSYAAAAKSLGWSVQTLKKWLEYLGPAGPGAE